MHEPRGWPPPAQPLVIDTQELTLGALIGEGGFGKVLQSQPTIGSLSVLPCCRCPPGPMSVVLAMHVEGCIASFTPSAMLVHR